MSCTLYFTKPNDPNLKQILVASHFLHKQINTQEIPKKYDPLILLTPEGSINQPNAILLYLAEDQLKGNNKNEEIQVFEWFEHFNLELHPLLHQIYEQLTNERPQNKQKYEYSLKELLRELELINNHLKLRTFLVGDSVTLVDISLGTHLETAFRQVISEEQRKKLPNLARWFSYIRSTGPFQAIFGQTVLLGKHEQKLDPPKTN